MTGFLRISLVSPSLNVGDVSTNQHSIAEAFGRCVQGGSSIVCFPELALTGYQCGDMFGDANLIQRIDGAIANLALSTASTNTTMIVGAPFAHADRLFNAAFVISRGKVAGIVLKTFLPNYKEFYEKRWFSSASDLADQNVHYAGAQVPLGNHLLFHSATASFGVEICEDLWSYHPPSTQLALAGANIIFNLSASNELIGKAKFRRSLVEWQSAHLNCIYAYVSSGAGESSTDLVYAAHHLVAENGQTLCDQRSFELTTSDSTLDVDVFKTAQLRRIESGFAGYPSAKVQRIELPAMAEVLHPNRLIERMPFVPTDIHEQALRFREVLELQSLALAKRCDHVAAEGVVLGLSGGLDSTWAAIVALNTTRKLSRPLRLCALSMPGFATSLATRTISDQLAKLLNFSTQTVDISAACRDHLKAIGHDGTTQDITYENTQARERTQLLMDYANKESLLVLGTSDLSELALGWATVAGDHISMYGINCGVPKTLVRQLVNWYAAQSSPELAKVLQQVLALPVSPELTTAAPNAISQLTEDIIGPYEAHDFFLYHYVRYGASISRLFALAKTAFAPDYSPQQLKIWMRIFFQRFFNNQFKRNCLPDGPKIGTISLSPRSDWRMPSDAAVADWLKEIDQLIV